MNTLLLFTAFVGICNAVNPAAVIRSEDAVDVSKFQPLKCRDGVLGPSDDQAARMQTECASKYGTGPGQQNPNCIYFCHSEILGLLNADGLPTRSAYDKFVEYNIVEEHRAMTTEWFRDCFDKYGHVDKTDTECKLAGQLNVCTWSIQPKLVCKV